MKPGLVFVYSNAISEEKEAEYNEWYNGIHAEECCVPGVRRLKRYKLADYQVPEYIEKVPYKYLAIYELDDWKSGIARMRQTYDHNSPSDSIDPSAANTVIYEEVYIFEPDHAEA